MQNSKLLQVLKTFSNVEMKHLGLMTISPYFNKKSELAALFNILREHYPIFADPELERKTVYRHLFAVEEYDDQRMRDIMKALTKLAEEVLLKSKKATVDDGTLRLILAYVERGQLELAKKICDSSLKALEKASVRDSEHYHLKCSLVNLKSVLSFRMNEGFVLKIAKKQVPLEVVRLRSASFIMDMHDYV